jgi:hypothetical protein
MTSHPLTEPYPGDGCAHAPQADRLAVLMIAPRVSGLSSQKRPGAISGSCTASGKGMRRAARPTRGGTRACWLSEHRVVVGASLRERLENVPVFDDLAVLKPEEVGGHCAWVLGRGLDQPVCNDDVSLADHTLDLDA